MADLPKPVMPATGPKNPVAGTPALSRRHPYVGAIMHQQRFRMRFLELPGENVAVLAVFAMLEQPLHRHRLDFQTESGGVMQDAEPLADWPAHRMARADRLIVE